MIALTWCRTHVYDYSHLALGTCFSHCFLTAVCISSREHLQNFYERRGWSRVPVNYWQCLVTTSCALCEEVSSSLKVSTCKNSSVVAQSLSRTGSCHCGRSQLGCLALWLLCSPCAVLLVLTNVSSSLIVAQFFLSPFFSFLDNSLSLFLLLSFALFLLFLSHTITIRLISKVSKSDAAYESC